MLGASLKPVVSFTCLWVLLGGSSPATSWAQPEDTGPPPAPAKVSPWAEGVTVEQKQRAGELVDKAHALHVNFQFNEAADTYEEALGHWSHPAIHLALGRVYISLVKPLAAHRHLREAIKWGPKPLRSGAYEAAVADLQRVSAQLAQIQLDCDHPDTEVLINGKPVTACKSSNGQLVRPDAYTITAQKPGYFPITQTVTLMPGKRAVVALQLVPEADGTVVKRRWRTWKPWLVVGAGAAAGALGGGLLWRSARDFAAADQAFEEACASAQVCPPNAPSPHQRAVWESRIGTGALMLGGAAVATGLALVVMNRPRVYRNEARGGATFEIVPILTNGTGGVSTRLSF